MRLLKRIVHPITKQASLILEEHLGESIPDYAILSHCWGPSSEEVSFADISNPSSALSKKSGYAKVWKSMDKAEEDGLDYLWVDTCCIDKSSSAELSEAINSMFAWYRDSAICYAYLADVNSGFEDPKDQNSEFRRSRWFTRGWTLQELLAPRSVIFLSQAWMEIGSKKSLASIIFEITRIDKDVLLHSSTEHISIAKRMSWAAGRETTRLEDRAYSLLGLFNVNMPTIYGEGKQAFQRLQNEILMQSGDHSIFAFGSDPQTLGYIYDSEDDGPGGVVDDVLPMFAASPDVFVGASEFYPMNHEAFWHRFGFEYAVQPYQLTNMGFSIVLPAFHLDLEEMGHKLKLVQNARCDKFYSTGFIFNSRSYVSDCLAAIACEPKTEPATVLLTCIILKRIEPRFNHNYSRHTFYERCSWNGRATIVIDPQGMNTDHWSCQQLYITGNTRSDDWKLQSSVGFWAPNRFLLNFKPPTLFEVTETRHPEVWDGNHHFNKDVFHVNMRSTAVIVRLRDTDERFYVSFGLRHNQYNLWCHIEPCMEDSSVCTLYDNYHKQEQGNAKHLPEELDVVTISSTKTPTRKLVLRIRATRNVSPRALIVRIEAFDQGGFESVRSAMNQNKSTALSSRSASVPQLSWDCPTLALDDVQFIK